MFDPELLKPDFFYIDGPYSNTDGHAGGHPCTVFSNLSDVVEMRLGNTLGELFQATWRPYKKAQPWLFPTGRPAERRIHVQTKHVDDLIIRWNPPLRERWGSYWYMPGDHVFYPASFEPSGGPDNNPYWWVDDSRWTIDTPETPDSVLAFITYFDANGTALQSLAGRTLRFKLRGDDLDLKGGSLFVWALGLDAPYTGNDCRMHYTSVPLTPGNGIWSGMYEIPIGAILTGWDYPPSHGGPPLGNSLDLYSVKSWGLSVRGMSALPTGRLSVCWYD